MLAPRSVKNRFRRAFASLFAGLPLVAAVLLSGCGDGDLFSPNRNKTEAQLALRTYYGSVSASQNEADINRIRLTVTVLPDGPTLPAVVVDVDPAATEWDLPIEVPANSELSVLVELINVSGGAETVEFSGTLPVIQVTSGPQPSPPPIAVFPGPPGNLSITAISIAPRNQNVLEGAEIPLTASVVGGGANPTIVWTSSDAAVASVDDNGLVRTLTPGSATITAAAGRVADAVTVTVGARATGVVIAPANPTATSHRQEIALTGSVVDPRGNPISGLTIEWSVADATVVSHAGNGVFLSLRNGATEITATARQGTRVLTGSTTFTVLQHAVSMSMSPSSTAFAAAGATQQFTVEALDANGHRVEANAIGWLSTDPAVATVNESGLVTAVGDGTTTIRATSGSVSAEATVTVARPASIEISPDQETLTFIGATRQLSAVVRDGSGRAMDMPVVWYSLNPDIADVDAEGLVTARADGTATIVAEVPTLRAHARIDVERTVTQIIFAQEAFTLDAGQTQQVNAFAADESGAPVESEPIVWSMADPAIASVSSTGLVRGLSEGITEVIARVGLHEARLAVRVIGTISSGPAFLSIVPLSPVSVGNCIPFGQNTTYAFQGIIYRNVPAFSINPGDKIAFDLGRMTNEDVRRNIYFSVANKNPEPASGGSSTSTQGVAATAWVKVVSDSHVPENPRGDFEIGNYELIYTAEASFDFPGGGFIIGFGSASGGDYTDTGCEQVAVITDNTDASGQFYARWYEEADLSLNVLDNKSGGNGGSLWGIKIFPASGPGPSPRPHVLVAPPMNRVNTVSPELVAGTPEYQAARNAKQLQRVKEPSDPKARPEDRKDRIRER